MKNLNIPQWIWIVGLSILGVWLIGSSYGAFHNFISEAARNAPSVFKFLGVIPLAIAIYFVVQLAKSKIESRGASILGIVVLFVLWVCTNCGFFFPAGDIKQYKTCFDLNGKVEDPEGCLIKDYNGFYKFDQDTALKNYVIKYNELPGVNHWAYNIRVGKTAPSTAPRANEYFEWHTGAYEKE